MNDKQILAYLEMEFSTQQTKMNKLLIHTTINENQNDYPG